MHLKKQVALCVRISMVNFWPKFCRGRGPHKGLGPTKNIQHSPKSTKATHQFNLAPTHRVTAFTQTRLCFWIYKHLCECYVLCGWCVCVCVLCVCGLCLACKFATQVTTHNPPSATYYPTQSTTLHKLQGVFWGMMGLAKLLCLKKRKVAQTHRDIKQKEHYILHPHFPQTQSAQSSTL